jgi:hypothetical protein
LRLLAVVTVIAYGRRGNQMLLRFPAAPRHVIRYTPERSFIYALHPPIVTKLKWLTGLYSDILHRIVLESDNKSGKYDGRTDIHVGV